MAGLVGWRLDETDGRKVAGDERGLERLEIILVIGLVDLDARALRRPVRRTLRSVPVLSFYG